MRQTEGSEGFAVYRRYARARAIRSIRYNPSDPSAGRFRQLDDSELIAAIARLQERIEALQDAGSEAAFLTRQGYLDALAEAEREQARRAA